MKRIEDLIVLSLAAGLFFAVYLLAMHPEKVFGQEQTTGQIILACKPIKTSEVTLNTYYNCVEHKQNGLN